MNKFKVLILPLVLVLIVGGMIGAGVLLSKSDSESTGTVLSATIQANENRLGNPTASIELVEYGDYMCPACASFNPMIKQLVSEYGDKFNFAYRHLPLKQIHKNATPAAEAAEAAGKQGKYWEMNDLLYATQSSWGTAADPDASFVKMAAELGLNQEQFIRDMDSDEVKAKVDSDYKTALSIGLNSTPSFFVNGEKIATPASYEAFVQALGLNNAQ